MRTFPAESNPSIRIRTSFSFVQRVRPDRVSKIDENVRPMAITKRSEVEGRVSNDSRACKRA